MNPLAQGCQCNGCNELRLDLTADSALQNHYGKRLLQRGWAGRTSPAEAAYVRAHAGWAQAAARVLQTALKPSDSNALPSYDQPTVILKMEPPE
jgi:hypothetical protein